MSECWTVWPGVQDAKEQVRQRNCSPDLCLTPAPPVSLLRITLLRMPTDQRQQRVEHLCAMEFTQLSGHTADSPWTGEGGEETVVSLKESNMMVTHGRANHILG